MHMQHAMPGVKPHDAERDEVVRLAIADPPYPPFVGSGGRKNRASRWYGDGQRSLRDKPSDNHANARRWDDPAAHRELLESLRDGAFDGWAIATSPDGVASYGNLPAPCRLMAWVKPNAQPGAHRIASRWEVVIVYPPEGRRSNRGGVGMVSDVLTANQAGRFIGGKPEAWTHWVLSAMSFDPELDEVVDMFPGSGAVEAAVSTYGLTPRLWGQS